MIISIGRSYCFSAALCLLVVISVAARARLIPDNDQTAIPLLLLPYEEFDYGVLDSLSFNKSESHSDHDGTSNCEQMYGFLPCSSSVFGHLFLIIVYEYLLFRGESYLAKGSERIFKILGPGVFGASAFQVLGVLPESLLLLASGLMNSKEKAQEYVFNTGVGLLAGSSILLLTLVWGTCLIVGRQNFSNFIVNSHNYNLIITENNNTNNSNYIMTKLSSLVFHFKRFPSLLTGCGINTDVETSYLARIMVFSVIPFVIMEVPNLFKLQSLNTIAILIALVVSLVFLLFFFVYQIFRPWIQKRRLEFVKHAHLVSAILQHVQKRAMGRLLTTRGAPNVNAIRRLFDEIDEDQDNFISASEVKELFQELKFAANMNHNKDHAIREVMEKFDLDGDRKITKNEFENGLINWLDEVKYAVDQQVYSPRSLNDIHQVFRPWVQNIKKEREIKRNLILEILKNIQNNGLENLLTQDGTPSLPNIKRLFEQFDRDGDNFISESELREVIVKIKFGGIPIDVNEAVEKMMKELDTSGDDLISEQEFVIGLSNLLLNSTPTTSLPPSQDDDFQKTWEETDKLVEEENKEGNDDESSPKAWIKAIMLLVLGIVILALLAEPLIENVQSFSESVGIPSFFISFILVPLATNCRAAHSAIAMASRKTPRTTSLTFSELYGGVFVNNIVGFSVLLSLIYFREMTWEFSAEVLVVLLVCFVVGIIASFRSSFALWTACFAYLLYPSSLLLVYVFKYLLHYT